MQTTIVVNQFSCVTLKLWLFGLLFTLVQGIASPVSGQCVAPSFSSQPADITVEACHRAIFSATAAGSSPLTYQWLLNGSPILGATNSTFTTEPLGLSDSGSEYQVSVMNACGVTQSSSATLSVVADVTPPLVANVRSCAPSILRLTFNDLVERASAEEIFSYSLDHGITIISVSLLADGKTVALLLDQPLMLATQYTLTINDVRDACGNPIPTNTQVSFQNSTAIVPASAIHKFTSAPNDGTRPGGTLTRASDGMLYGTTSSGGSGGGGTVFRLALDGSGYMILRHFSSFLPSGSGPNYPPIEGSDALLYGTTTYGGSSGVGLIYRMNKDGSNYQTLRNFQISNSSPFFSRGSLTEASNGFLYGTSGNGGANFGGTIFRLKPDGSNFSIVKSFATTGTNPRYPLASVIEASDGYLYGTTSAGGTGAGGTVFKIQMDGTGFATVHNFAPMSGATSSTVFSTVLEASDGVLYGTTVTLGSTNGGTIYKVNKDGTGFSTLMILSSVHGIPDSTLVEGSDGVLYGAAFLGGSSNGGTVYRINKDGSSFAVISNFGTAASASSSGSSPRGQVVQGPDGALYGATFWGSTFGNGAIYKLGTCLP